MPEDHKHVIESSRQSRFQRLKILTSVQKFEFVEHRFLRSAEQAKNTPKSIRQEIRHPFQLLIVNEQRRAEITSGESNKNSNFTFDFA